MSKSFAELCECSGGNVKVELDRSNYVSKADMKEAANGDISKLAAK